ncbi:MAG: 3-dehydroquinate synthase [Candidatus Bathyarchaeota archaeon]|nr:3-dehydroquinate synthase [Candidatus Bathyarchaeota archaeon]
MTVRLGVRSYPVYVALGLISGVGSLIAERLPSAAKCAIVTSENIWGIHGRALAKSLEAAGFEADIVHVPDGEKAKSWSEAARLIGELLDLGFDRRSTLIAFGGGAVGDLAGFVAAIYLRGINLVQIPTTLLAHVDSAIGGKAAVNHPKGKNLIGAFKQPGLVVSDPELLASLPEREMRSGLAEVVKYGVIADSKLFKNVEEKGDALRDAEPDALTEVVRRCVVIKARYVEEDERDLEGIRAALNYGHTMGHAVETLMAPRMRHGEAVAIGMEFAGRISAGLGLMEEGELERQRGLLASLGLETGIPELKLGDILDALSRDKKVEGGSVRFVLPTGIGTAPVLRPIDKDLIVQELGRAGVG